jgi:hypothetical protein
VVEEELGGGAGNPESERGRVWGAIVKTRVVQPASSRCAVGPSEDDRARRDAGGGRFKCKLGVAGKVLQGVKRCTEPEVDRDFEAPALSGDEAVAAYTMFTGIDA